VSKLINKKQTPNDRIITLRKVRDELVEVKRLFKKLRDNPVMVNDYGFLDKQIKLVQQKINLTTKRISELQSIEPIRVIGKDKKILCIVGESGTGKSMLSEYIQKTYMLPLIKSYTTRPKRDDTDNGHTFLTDEEFDKINPEDMIAYTHFGDSRYCCVKEDVVGKNTYVIDEDGLIMLKNKYSDDYEIKSLRLIRNNREITQERKDRDDGRFNLPLMEFDYILKNDGTKEELFKKAHYIVDDFFFKNSIMVDKQTRDEIFLN
jgi:guanylate kinase